MKKEKRKIGFTCAYTPLPLIHAAGFIPYRILPDMDSPDQAGHILHDNLCPHVKRVLDRAMSENIPLLDGSVFLNSCDSMRRLYDAWHSVKPEMKLTLIDLPVAVSPHSIDFFKNELMKLLKTLEEWSDSTIANQDIYDSIELYNTVAGIFQQLNYRVMKGSLENGAAALQKAYNFASTHSPQEVIDTYEPLLTSESKIVHADGNIPVFIFGNILPIEEAFSLFEDCGAKIVGNDLCTGSRLFGKIAINENEEMLHAIARSLLQHKPCARTFRYEKPGSIAEAIVAQVKEHNAEAVIGYTAKFCDPYIARLPGIREELKKEGIPFLMLEGDCTLRAVGQQRTRIEAFIEMMR